ncbi:MAG: hypothetical protein ACYDD1_13695 [Caulobacteraceae bacterium]
MSKVVFTKSELFHRPEAKTAERGFFGSCRARLGRGRYVAHFSAVFPNHLPDDAVVAFEVLAWDGDEARFLGRQEFSGRTVMRRRFHDFPVPFSAEDCQRGADTMIEYRCFTSHDCAHSHLMTLHVRQDG